MTCQTDKKILGSIAVYRFRNGLGVCIGDDPSYFTDFHEIDNHYVDWVKGMLEELTAGNKNYKIEEIVINMVPEFERGKIEDLQPLDEKDYDNLLRKLKMK